MKVKIWQVTELGSMPSYNITNVVGQDKQKQN